MITTRRTIAREVEIEGIGLHLGKPCRMLFKPAAAGSGITFVRMDRGGARLPATAAVAVLAERRTQLGEGDDTLHTVEHVLAAVSEAVPSHPSRTEVHNRFWSRWSRRALRRTVGAPTT